MQEGPTFGLSPEIGASPTPEEKKETIKVTILDVTRVPSMSPERIGKFDLVIVYQTPDGRTLMISVPEEEVITEEGEINWDKLKEIIKKDIEKRRKLVGKSLEITM